MSSAEGPNNNNNMFCISPSKDLFPCFIFKDIHWSKLYILPTPPLCFSCNFCLGDPGQPGIVCFPIPDCMLSSNSWDQQKKME